MKYVITRDAERVEYGSNAFWQQFDEVEVEDPSGWYLRYVSGGMVHTFGYCQSSGRGEYYDEYREEVYKVPLAFSNDLKANAEIMHKAHYDNMRAELVREPQNKA